MRAILALCCRPFSRCSSWSSRFALGARVEQPRTALPLSPEPGSASWLSTSSSPTLAMTMMSGRSCSRPSSYCYSHTACGGLAVGLSRDGASRTHFSAPVLATGVGVHLEYLGWLWLRGRYGRGVQVDLLFDPFGGRWEDLRDAAVRRRGRRLRRRVALRPPRRLGAPRLARPRVLDRPQRARRGGAAAGDRVAGAQRRQPGRRHAGRDGGDAPGGQRRPAAAGHRRRWRRRARRTPPSSWRSGDRSPATPLGGRRSSRRSPRCARCGRARPGVPAGSCDPRRHRR